MRNFFIKHFNLMDHPWRYTTLIVTLTVLGNVAGIWLVNKL